eukprot:scaffold281636_cov35-Tisochrysis_lutea.AAC.1
MKGLEDLNRNSYLGLLLMLLRQNSLASLLLFREPLAFVYGIGARRILADSSHIDHQCHPTSSTSNASRLT